MSKSRTSCPGCGEAGEVIPVVYGTLERRRLRQAAAGAIVMGGTPLYEDERDPTHFCKRCETSFRPG